MRKILLVAKRDYLQTVLSKAYLFGLILLPLIFGGRFLAIALANKTAVKDQHIAIVDHTGVSAAAIIQACEDAHRKGNANDATGLRAAQHFIFEEVKPDADESAQLLSLSDRVRRTDF